MVDMMGKMNTKDGSSKMKPDMGKKMKGKMKMDDSCGMMPCPSKSMAKGKKRGK